MPSDRGPAEATRFTAYAWVDQDWTPDSAPDTLKAVRIWGDVLLELVSERRSIGLRPPVSTRRTALFAWPTPLPPESLAQETIGRTRVQLELDAELCAAADVHLSSALYDPESWKRLRDWLIDQGFDEELVEEDITPVLAPASLMFVAQGRAVVDSTTPELLEALVVYFEPMVLQYLNTWTTLRDALIQPTTEIIAPTTAIFGVVG